MINPKVFIISTTAADTDTYRFCIRYKGIYSDYNLVSVHKTHEQAVIRAAELVLKYGGVIDDWTRSGRPE